MTFPRAMTDTFAGISSYSVPLFVSSSWVPSIINLQMMCKRGPLGRPLLNRTTYESRSPSRLTYCRGTVALLLTRSLNLVNGI